MSVGYSSYTVRGQGPDTQTDGQQLRLMLPPTFVAGHNNLPGYIGYVLKRYTRTVRAIYSSRVLVLHG